MTLSISNFGPANSTSGGAGLTVVIPVTAVAGDIILCGFFSFGSFGFIVPPTISGVVDAANLNWQKRFASGVINIDTQSPAEEIDFELWWAPSPGGLINNNVTATFSGGNGSSGAYAGFYLAVSNANAVTPFDVDASLPATHVMTSTGGNSVSINTSNANDLIIGVIWSGNPASTPGHPGTGFTTGGGDTNNSALGTVADTEYQIVSVPQSGLSVVFGVGDNTAVPNGSFIYADAIVAGSGASSPGSAIGIIGSATSEW